MESTTPRIRSLLRQADRVADAGKRAAAENLYRQIIEEAPDNAAAWAGLGQVVHSPAEKEASFHRALELDPDNAKAQSGMALLKGERDPNNQEELESAPEEDETEKETKNQKVDQGSKESEQLINDAVFENPSEQFTSVDESDHVVVTASESEGVLYCANHPNRQTHLRCNRCGKPICSSCAKPTPVGYRCPQCIREHEDIYFTATALDYVVAVLVAFPLSLLAGWIATFLGFFSIFLGAAAGTFIGRIVFRAAGRRRGRWMPQLVGAIVVIGGIIPALPALLILLSGHFSLQLIWTGIYIVAAAGAAYYQMR